jgi:hypothetical protein
MIDVVIPTMWRDENFLSALQKYCKYDTIQKIYLIDNDYAHRPKQFVHHEKIEIINYCKNIYVNAAWNEGYYRSKANVICFLNDDIFVDSQVFEYVNSLDFSEIDIIGVHLKGSTDNYHIVEHPDKKEELVKLKINKMQPIGGQSYAFGVCMFIKRSSYRVIPSLYQVWYGDDYLTQRCENIFILKTSKIRGEISKTIMSKDIQNNIKGRIKLDTHNVFKYNHFFNGKNWDIVRKTMRNLK